GGAALAGQGLCGADRRDGGGGGAAARRPGTMGAGAGGGAVRGLGPDAGAAALRRGRAGPAKAFVSGALARLLVGAGADRSGRPVVLGPDGLTPFPSRASGIR